MKDKLYGLKEVADVTFYDLKTDKPILFVDTLKMTTIENKAESSYARGGKGNPKLLGWDYNREATVQMQDALMSTKSISLLTGNQVKVGATTAHGRGLFTAVVGATGKTKVTLEKAPIANSVTVYTKGDRTQEIKNTVTANDITFDVADVPVGTELEVFYKFTTDANAQTITISADKFPSYVKVVGDTVIRNAETGEDEAFQFIIHKAKISPSFTLTFQADGDPTVFDINLDIFRRTEDTEMIELIQY